MLQLIASNSFLAVNKYIAKEFGLDSAVLLAELASAQIYFEQRGELDGDGMFYLTCEQIEKNTTLSQHRQAKACQPLEAAGVLRTKKKGLPPMKYYSLDGEQMTKLFNQRWSKILINVDQKSAPTLVKNFNTNNNTTINKTEYIKQSFDRLWTLYPRKQGKKEALEAYKRAVRDGVTPEEVEKGITAYNTYIKESAIDPQYIKQGSTFFRQRAWGDDWTPRKPRARNGFNNFEHNEYDFDQLEKELLQ